MTVSKEEYERFRRHVLSLRGQDLKAYETAKKSLIRFIDKHEEAGVVAVLVFTVSLIMERGIILPPDIPDEPRRN